jgi:hypothetical protein
VRAVPRAPAIYMPACISHLRELDPGCLVVVFGIKKKSAIFFRIAVLKTKSKTKRQLYVFEKKSKNIGF